MKKVLIAFCIICTFVLPVFANDMTKTLKATIEKNDSDFTHFFIYEEHLKKPKFDRGHSFEIFGYNANNNKMCNLYVINLNKGYSPLFSDNSQDNICFGLNKVNGRIYAVDYNVNDYYFYRKEMLYFENNFKNIRMFQKAFLEPKILQEWAGEQVSKNRMFQQIKEHSKN